MRYAAYILHNVCFTEELNQINRRKWIIIDCFNENVYLHRWNKSGNLCYNLCSNVIMEISKYKLFVPFGGHLHKHSDSRAN